MSAQIDFTQSPIAVGSSGAGTFQFTNSSTAGETALFIDRIVLEPSCRNAGETPPCTDREPGIFAISDATGAPGTACQGITFTIQGGQMPFVGSVEFDQDTPIPAMLVNETCLINFTYTALAVPTVDTQPGEPGQDTDQAAVVRPDSGGGPVNSDTATDFTAVEEAQLTPDTPVVGTTPLTTTPLLTPTTATPIKKCKKGQKLKKGKCVKKKRKKK